FDVKKEAEAADKEQQLIAGFLVNQLYQNNNPATDAIKATTTQATIDTAQAQIDLLLPSAVKTDLQNKLNRAQELLDAQKAVDVAVNELFEGNNPANKIKETVTQADIDAAQAKVDKVTDSAKKAELQAHIDKAQAEFDVKKEAEAADKGQQLIAGFLVNQLYQNNEPLTDAIKATTNQAAIDKAQAQIDLLLPSAVKTDLQNKLNRAQELLNATNTAEVTAEKAVNELFEGNNPANALKETVTQAELDAAQAKVDAVTDTAKKAELQAHVDKAQSLLDAANEKEAQENAAKTLVDGLFTDKTHAALKESTTQGHIDTAKTKVNQLAEGPVKAALLEAIEQAQELLNARESVNENYQKAKASVDALFSNAAHTNLDKNTTQHTIDQANALVQQLPAGAEKEALIQELNKAQELWNKQPLEKPQIDTVYNNATQVTGKGTPGMEVVVTIQGKTYKGTVNANGDFAVTIPEQAAGTVIQVQLANGKGGVSATVSVSVTNYIPMAAPEVNPVGPYQQTVTGKAPAGTKMVRLLVNGIAQRTAVPDEDGSFSIYSRFNTDGVKTNLRLEAGDQVTVDYGIRTPIHLKTTVTVLKELVKPVVNPIKANDDYIMGFVPAGTSVLRLVVNGVPQRTITAVKDLEVVAAGGIDPTGKFKMYSRFIVDEKGERRKLRDGDRVTIDAGVQIPGYVGETITVGQL
ncbi:toxin Cry1Ac domain D-VI-related protein, partial [Paenilisteria rocourtiae]